MPSQRRLVGSPVPSASENGFVMLSARLRDLLREPLVHFFAIGLTVFAIFGDGGSRSVAPSQGVIEVTPAQVTRLAQQFQAVWRRRPSEVELRGLVADYVREEVYYREALALGLDRDDAVIRRRLRQKMEFLSETGAEQLAIDEADLRAWYEMNRARYSLPPRLTFRQLLFASEEAAEQALAEGVDPASSGRATLLPQQMESAGALAVEGTFGEGFFDAVSRLSPGDWQGPIISTFGAHLVQVIDMEAASLLEFDEVRDVVEGEWRREAADELRETQYQALRARYEVVLPGEEAME